MKQLVFYAGINDHNATIPHRPGTPLLGSLMEVTTESSPEEVHADMARILRWWADRLEGKPEPNVIDFTRPEPFAVGTRVRYSGVRYGDPPEAYGTIMALVAGDQPYRVAWDDGDPFRSGDRERTYPASVLEKVR